MKVYNLGRGQGKTARILTVSEYEKRPIICATEDAKHTLLAYAERYGYKIPTPLTVNDLKAHKVDRGEPEYLVDEALSLLQYFIQNTSNGVLREPLAMSVSIDD